MLKADVHHDEAEVACYICRSALTSFLLEVAQTFEAGVVGLDLDFAEAKSIAGNWRVTRIDAGAIDAALAHAAVARSVRGNTEWVMVEDGSPLDGLPSTARDS